MLQFIPPTFLFEIHPTCLVSDYLEEKNDFYEGVCKKQVQDRSARKLLVADLAILEAHEMGIDWFAFLAAQLHPKKSSPWWHVGRKWSNCNIKKDPGGVRHKVNS